MKTSSTIYLIFIFLILNGCELTEIQTVEPIGIVDGVKPIYAPSEGWDAIFTTDPQPIENLGKIYYKDNFIYVNERSKGIHIIDNSDPINPIVVKFIQVLGSADIAIKGDILYADNITDLVAIDISNLEEIKVTSRFKNIYPSDQRSYPDGYSGYFECVNPDLGIVMGWEEARLENPSCLR